MCEPLSETVGSNKIRDAVLQKAQCSVLYKEELIQPVVKRKRIYKKCEMRNKRSKTKKETLIQDRVECTVSEEIIQNITPNPASENCTDIKSENCVDVTSENCVDVTSDNITVPTITSNNYKEEDTYLYLSQSMYNKLISSNIEDDKDITFQCIETTTKEGFRVLVYNNSNKNNLEIGSMIEDHDIIDKLLFQVPSLEPDITSESLGLMECRCKICGMAFTETKRLQIHLALYHSNGANTLLHCWVCERNCETVADYLAHIKDLHPEDIFKCPVCGDVTGSMKSLSTHINNAHFNIAKYVCDYCDAKFRSPHTRQYHIRNKHQTNKRINNTTMCEICMKVFQHERSLLRHTKQIHQGKREMCTICDQTYSSLSSLYVHQRSKHNKVTYHCGFCSLSFKSTSSVTKHEAKMHDVSRTFSQTTTERIYHYKHVTDENVIVKRTRRGESTKHISCNNCRTEFSCHNSYTKHCEKFHQGEYQIQ